VDTATLHQRLAARFGDAVLPLEDGNGAAAPVGDRAIRVRPDALVEVCRFLKSDPELAFDCLSNQSGVDYPARNEIEVVYHLFSYARRSAAVLKTSTARDDPALPSVAAVWATAIWQEREIFDLLGVVFAGHPDLRRILLPEDWVGHPLRKDFVEPTEYHGISTKRESML
jgi:NADH-quinone oxidoreductase subunit C